MFNLKNLRKISRICFLLYGSFLFADDSALISTLENDPSAFIEGKVNAVTGQPALYAEDLVIMGQEPIRITRTYKDGDTPDWRFCVEPAQITETEVSYRWVIWEKDRCPILYKKIDEVKLHGKKYIRCEPSNLQHGFSNTSRGKISSRTNLQNNRVFIEENFNHFIVKAADGTIRKYKKEGKEYLLLSEQLPNGNWILYKYKEVKKRIYLRSIRTTNPSKTKTYAKADFDYRDRSGLVSKDFCIVGSDGQKVEYRFNFKDGYHIGSLQSVKPSSAPTQIFGYVKYQNVYPNGKKGDEKHRISELSFPSNRKLILDYYQKVHEKVAGFKVHLDRDYKYDGWVDDPSRNCVKTISAPIGLDSKPHITHSFIYRFKHPVKGPFYNKTSVYDIERNWTDYYSDSCFRLKKIKRYSKDGKCLGKETFDWKWDTGFLKRKVHFNGDLKPISFTRYIYDDIGNIVEEKFFGNLSGKGSLPSSCDQFGFPKEDGCELSSIKYRYSSGRLSLLLEEQHDSGLRVVYEYLPKTDLILSKLTYDKDRLTLRSFYEYNADQILVREIEDNGSSPNPHDLSDVTVRNIKQINPLESGPYIGMPHIIEEKYWENAQEKLLKKTALSYTTRGKVEKEEVYDANQEHKFVLNVKYEKGLPIEKTNALGQLEAFSYDELGNLTSHSGKRLTTTAEYDFSNRVTAIQKQGDDGICYQYRLGYDRKHNLTDEIDYQGNQTQYRYDAMGRRIATILPPIPSEGGELITPVLHVEFDSSSNPILKRDAMNYETNISYNAYGKPTQIIHPDGTKEENTYYVNGNLKTHINPIGVCTFYEYDSLGQIVKKTITSLQGSQLAVETFVYKGKQLISKTDSEGFCTTYEYDGAGRKISEETNRERIGCEYDALGRVCKIICGDRVEVSEYDLLDRVIGERTESLSGGLLREVAYEYDISGNQKTIIRSVNGEKSYTNKEYDSFSRLIQTTDPLGHIETTAYNDFFQNELGQKVLQKTHTDPMGLKTIETMNTHSKVSKIQKEKDSPLCVEEKIYNANDLVTLQTNTIFSPTHRQIQTKWSYDSRGRCTTLTEENGKTTHHSYTPTGKLEETIKPNGVRIQYAYNDLGSNTLLSSSDGTVCHQMEYNRLGHLIASDGITRRLDAKGRILQETFPEGYSIENNYDTMGRKSQTRIPQADCVVGFEYNPLYLTKVHRKTQGGNLLYTHSYGSRDLCGNLLEEMGINGSSINYNIDPLSRKTAIQTPFFSQQILEFDPVGNIRNMKIQEEEISYTYDDLYQLTSETGTFAHNYAYDPLNNRLQKDDESYEINSLNQVVSHFEYDPNGNPISHGDTRYSYDALDRLVRIETPDLIETYTYDSQHRRLSKTTIKNDSQETSYFLYSGQNEIGSFNEQLKLHELRILGHSPHAEIGAAIAIELQGEIYLPIHDLQGNIAALLPLTNGDPNFYRYSAFGEEQTLSSILNPWRFSSKRTDATNLIYFGRRYYTPTFGRWLTPDPAGFTDGINLYSYVHNDPLTHSDEYGLVTYVPYGKHWENSTWGSPYSYTSPCSQSYNSFLQGAPESYNQTKLPSQLIPSQDWYYRRSPHYYVNGIWNRPIDSPRGGLGLYHTLGPSSNVIPMYSESFGRRKDLGSVCQMTHNPDYDSFFVRRFKRELGFTSLCMDIMHDDRKIFITAFSRGAGDTYHTVKDFTPEQSNRLIITACGPVMLLPRHLGYSVTNLIAEGDWCSRFCTRNERKHLNPDYADVHMIKQPYGIFRLTKEHYFLNPTYQEGISAFTKPDYDQFGGFR